MLVFPNDVYGQKYLKGGASIRTDVSSGLQIPVDNINDVLIVTESSKGFPAFTVDEYGNPTYFTDFERAEAYFGDKEVGELVKLLFNPVYTGNNFIRGAERVYGYRVGSPTRASAELLNFADTFSLVDIFTRDYGTTVNNIEFKIVENANTGREGEYTLSVRQVDKEEISPEIGELLRIYYTGNHQVDLVTAVHGSTFELQTMTFTDSTDGTDTFAVDVLNSYKTLAEVVAYINAQDNYRAIIGAEADTTFEMKYSDTPAGVSDDLTAPELAEVPTEIVQVVGGDDYIEFVTDVEADGRFRIGDSMRPTPTDDYVTITAIDGKFVYTDGTLASVPAPSEVAGLKQATRIISPRKIVSEWINNNSSLISAVATTSNTNWGTRFSATTGFEDYAQISSDTAGTYPAVTVQDWLDVQDDIEKKLNKPTLIFLNTTDVDIIKDFTSFAQTQRTENYVIYPVWAGNEYGESKATIINNLQQFDSKDLRYCVRGGKLKDRYGDVYDRGGKFLSAIGCGLEAGSGLTNPITGTRLPFLSLESDYTDADIYDIIRAGGIISDISRDGKPQFQIAVTTVKDTNRFNNIVYLQTQLNVLEMDILREVQKNFFGDARYPMTANGIVMTVESILESRTGEDGFLIAGVDELGNAVPPYHGITVSMDNNGVAKIGYTTNHVDEIDFINIVGKAEIANFTVTSEVSVQL